ncbi:hypothetical protein [Motiliproteus sp. MSK22-1]|uniref:hypothetical protein n=1 Tax=Motiliproteus sp. MSK22-1 TaxID=1897630 RepID=UPI0009764C56|nr:hypothetical protein [Motiliproteus sp. MSK22-1]OMH25278.1 hypothetical protein BGP75_26120 [Motiliproteus sp. MSK22-1]
MLSPRTRLSTALSALLVCTTAQADGIQVEVVDKLFRPAGSMLAYTEFELSGEPLAESLGLDLDILDPDQLNYPTAFDYSAGIESYEYSEEAMYALNYQSKMGPHLANGPLNAARGGNLDGLGARFLEMAKAVAFPPEEIPLNIYPISLPYEAGLPEFSNAVDTSSVSSDEVEYLDANGKSGTQTTQVPAYFRDYSSLAWTSSKTNKTINPATVGGILLKEVMWSQDFLGGMHIAENDEEVEATSSQQDQDGVHALGVSAADGMNGMILTELSLDKLLIMQNQLGYDGKKLGVTITPDYDPTKGAIWFPHKVAAEEVAKNNVGAIGKLSVSDGQSTLRDSWMMLWPVSEYFAFSDQRKANTAQNPSFYAVFDGAPFAAAPAVNTDADQTNDIQGTDAFSVASNLSNLLFKNISALHFNSQAGTLVDSYSADGKQGAHVTTYDAAYSLVALSIYQRSQDALPVGYASADGSDVNLKSANGQKALAMIKSQADFIIENLIATNGLVIDGITLKGKTDSNQSLDSQFAVVRGLTAAFLATEDEKYRTAARNLYLNIDKKLFDNGINTWAQTPGKITEHTPWTAAAISGALREAMLHLKNQESESDSALELSTLSERYVGWFRGVINGPDIGQGMQLAEWLGDSGEHQVDGGSKDNDGDKVARVTEAGGPHGTAMVMASKVKVSSSHNVAAK